MAAGNCARHSTFGIRQSRRGFSFTELLFAVMILGIGFIMLAAIFPVGLSQTKSNYEESLGAGIGRGASHQLGQIASEARLKPSLIGTVPTGLSVPAGKSVSLGLVMSPRDKRLTADLWTWKDVCRNLVLSSDPRFAWSPLFLRKTTYTNKTLAPIGLDNGNGGVNPALDAEPDSLAQVIMIGLRMNNRSEYEPSDFLRTATPATVFYQIEPKPVRVKIVPGATGYEVTFSRIMEGATPAEHGFKAPPPGAREYPGVTLPTSFQTLYDAIPSAIAPGAFFIIADDHIIEPQDAIGRMNGRIYRIGNNINGNTWELMPGHEFTTDPGPDGAFALPANLATSDDIVSLGITNADKTGFSMPVTTVDSGNWAVAYVVGKGFSESAITPDTTSASTYEGGIQDISVYTSFVAVKK